MVRCFRWQTIVQAFDVYLRNSKWLKPITRCTVFPFWPLTHWGRVTHICVSKLTIIGSDNGLSPGRRRAIIWTNAGILFIWPSGTNFSEISIDIQTFSFKKIHFKMSSGKWRPFCLVLNMLMAYVVLCPTRPSLTVVSTPLIKWLNSHVMEMKRKLPIAFFGGAHEANDRRRDGMTRFVSYLHSTFLT